MCMHNKITRDLKKKKNRALSKKVLLPYFYIPLIDIVLYKHILMMIILEPAFTSTTDH